MIDLGIDYHPGNYLPDHPAGNMRRRCIDNGDGTATETTWDERGVVLSEHSYPYEASEVVAKDLGEAVVAIRAQAARLSQTGPTAIALMAVADALDGLDGQ